MAGDKFDQLYNALKADGAVSGSRENFKNFVYASGKQGYLNRKKLYDALHADGAVSSNSYEEFAQRLGLHAVKPQQPTKQSSKPQTAAQMAMAQGRKQEDVDYTKPPKPLQSKPQWKSTNAAPKNASTFVNSLYVADDEKRMNDAEMIKQKGYTSRGGAKKMLEENKAFDELHAKDAADMIVNDERRRRNQPIIKTDTPADEYIGKTQGQLEDEASQTAKKMIDSDMGGYLDKVIGDEFKNAHAKGIEALNAAGGGFTHGAGGADWFIGERAYQQQMDSQKQLEQITGNIKNNIETAFSDPKVKQKVLDDAAHLGVDPEEYVKNFLAPSLIDKAGEQFNKTQLNRMMAKGASDYIASGILDSLTGALLTGLTTSKNQRQMQQEANAMTEGGMNPNYKPGTWAQAGRGAVAFTADAPAYAMAGVGANALTGKVFGSAAQQAIKAANQSVAKRVFSGITKGVVHGGATGFQYGFVNGAVQNFSTGEDTSLGSTLKAGLKSAVTEGASFATMEGMGGAVGGLGYKVGVKGTERTTRSWINHAGQKLGYEAIKTGMEGIGMATGGVAASYANHILTGEDWKGFSTEGTLESCASAVVFKLTHAKDIFKGEVGRDGKPLNFKKSVAQKMGRFFLSDGAKNSHNVFSDEEKHQLYSAGANVGMKPMEDIISFAKQAKDKKVKYEHEDPYQDTDIPMIKNAYDQIMADPNVSWDAKAKFTTLVMGTMPESRPMMDYVGVGTEEGTDSDGIHTYKTINEYAKDGTLLSKQRYDTRDQRDSIIYNLKVKGEDSRLGNALALLVGQDRNNYDLQNAFFKKKATGWEQVQEIVDGMNTEGSTIDKEFSTFVMNAEEGRTMPLIDAVAKENGMERKDLITAWNKDPLKRTDAEQNACIKLRKAVEEVVFPKDKVHEEQSQLGGKDVAEENGLGTEQPNGEAVRAELSNLTQAEDELEQFMKDNDVFGQNFENLQKKGLTNPQIYAWMIENGLTEEQLTPFAKYINANARVQGMQNATQQMIEQKVSAYVQDWSMHGTLNGEKQNGEQAVWVQDGSGRTLVLGSGDVAFDSTTGHAKEGVGDMIICFDPNKYEMVYLKAEDVTFFQTQKVEDFGNEYRRKLQQINSLPYEQAAREQAEQNAAKSQSQAESKVTDQTQNAESQQEGKIVPQDDTNLPKDNTTSGKVDTTDTTKEAATPQAGTATDTQQTRKFADGTDVPMTTDGNGKPTPDFNNMTAEQSAEVIESQFGDNADKFVDAQIKKAQKALKDAEKMKVDYSDFNGATEQQAIKDATIAAAKEQLDKAEAVKKALTARKVAETMKPKEETPAVEGAHEAGSVAAEKFQKATRVQGNTVTKRLPDGTKISGHYEIVPAESLTPSHDINNGYKKSDGFPVDAEGRTINDRDYENDKSAQQTTDQMALKYNGQAITQVPTVSDEGIVYDGNGRTMAGQKAAKEGTDAEYIEDLMDNAQNYGFTKEQIAESGIEHPRLVMVTDERLPYDTATFSKFNRNEKKTQSNTEQAVAKAKILTADEVGAIVADIEGNGSLDAFFNNPKAINDLVKTLVSKGIIGQNEVAGFMDGTERLSAQGKEYVKNLLLGSVFKPETIRMLGVDSKIKNAAINGIRPIMDNMKLGDYSLRDEIDQAVQLLYEARRSKASVDDLLKQSSAFEGNARDRFSPVAQAMAQALEGNASTFRDLMREYNEIAQHYNSGEGDMFGEHLSPDELVKQFLEVSKTIKNNEIKLYGNETGNREQEGGNHAASNEEPAKEAGGAVGTEGNEPAETEPEVKVKKAIKRIATEITKQTGIEVVTDEKTGQSALEDAEATDSNVKYHKETDEEVLNQLNSGETIKVYRAMQVIDGKLYPPMAAYADGKLVEANEIGQWIRSDEMPDSKNTVYKYKSKPTTIPKSRAIKGEDGVWRDSKNGVELACGEDGNPTWYFKLEKGKGATGKKLTDVPAAYNPYWHMSRSPLNDQFKSAWIRPNIVVVECEVPVSELTSGYKAERAKDAVGEVDWKSGSVSGEVFKQTGRARKVILSRWCKPVRVLDDAEVAERAKEFVGEAKVEIPENVLTPKQRIAFEEAGFKIGAPEKGVKKSEQIAEAMKKGLQINNSIAGVHKEFRSKNGEVYGFVHDGKIYLDTKKMKPETPLHEYTHLWTEALKNGNPKEWENVKKLFDEVEGLKEEVQQLYPELKGDDLYEEMITTYSGREGAKKLEETVRNLAAKEGKSVEESSKAKGFIDKVKDALKTYWKGVADMLGIHFTSAEEVADKVLADWASGVNPKEVNVFDSTTKDIVSELTKRALDSDFIKESAFEYDTDKEIRWISDELRDILKDDKAQLEKIANDNKLFSEILRAIHGVAWNAKNDEFVKNTKKKGKKNALPLLPKGKKPDPKFEPIEAAAEDYKKEHPMTEEEIRNTTAFDDLPEDQKQYCIDAAVDYLNGEDTSSTAEAYYRNAYGKRGKKPAEVKEAEKESNESIKAEQPEPSSDPMEGLQKAADEYKEEKTDDAVQQILDIAKTPRGQKPKTTSRKELEAERDAADNELEQFMKELRKKRSGQLNSGFIDQNLIEAAPKMFSLAAKCAYTRIKLGMHDAKEVVKDLRERFKEAFEGFDKRDIETFYSEIMNQKWRDGDQRMSLNDWAEYYRKNSPEHKANLEGDSKDAEGRKRREKKFMDKINLKLGFGGKINGIVELRKMAEECGLKDIKDTDLQELAETAIVQRARGIASSGSTNDKRKFELVKKLYENQPSLNQRDSERVMKGQFSTPAPYAFLADMYVKGNGKEIKSALEPSAGNGMLTIGLPMDVVHVNDIDAQRLANLRRQGFKNVTSQDGTQPFSDKDVDVVVTNPPFGSAPKKVYDGYEISSLEGQMAINALESMKDDGRAAIIIGGKTEYATNGSLKPKDKAFLGYLYSHYNVEDVINVDGSLYAKQGTTYPTRIILINGRRYDENVFPPVKGKARAEAVKDYDELYKRINDDILQSERMGSPIGEGAESARLESDTRGSDDNDTEGLRVGGTRVRERQASTGLGGVSEKDSVRVASDALGGGGNSEQGTDGGLHNNDTGADAAGAESSQSERRGDNANRHGVGGGVRQSGDSGRANVQHHADGSSSVLKPKPKQERSLSSEKVGYTPKSENPFTLQSVMPADQQEAVGKNLAKLGDADQFLVDELGYNDKDDLYAHLAAEQVDSVALALQQAKKGNAFIIGDQTGIGKGRQAASLIRYAKKQGQVPIYFTKTAGLLSDVYRDLVDIGSSELRPFVFGSANEAAITDSKGNVVFPLPSDAEVARVLDYIKKNGKLPKEYDYILTTYSQVGGGLYDYEADGSRKERKVGKSKSAISLAKNSQNRRDAVERLVENGYLILDESHTAGGKSGQSAYFQHIIQKAKNVTFFSATFAKRPDNMPIYALRTAMNQGGLEASELIDAVKRGGATLQEIMSQTLTQCGQMIRRERDMTGVTIDWRAIDDPETVAEQREQYDSIIGLFNDIINFQKTYVKAYVEKRNEELAEIQSSMAITRGAEALGIKNVPFASKAFNTVQQVLLSLKAKSAAGRAIEYLKQGMKPVIAVNNTNESQTDGIALGEEMDAPDLGTSLRKGLEGTLRYTTKDAKDKGENGYIKLEDLGDGAIEAYHELEEKIANTSTGLSLSPIDVIKNELQKAGYKVGELTGRSTEFVYNDNGTVTKVKRTDTDKKKLAREFNDGQIDALILNKSAATGISLHASSKYADQRKRVMIVAQQQLDVNDEVQMRGRIDRTGQVARGAYEYVVSLIPAEQRLLMMFKAKLKSLDANTTSSQKSKFNEMEVADITNKYGDKVVREYMAEHLDLYSRMADPFGWENTYGDNLSSISPEKLVSTKSNNTKGDGEAGGDASKLLARMALLKVSEQEKMLNEIGEQYANEIQRLNEMGENDLEITELPLKAKTIRKEVWKEGSEPGGDNAFADNTYIEKVNMAILKKPMKAEEVKRAQDGLTGGKSWDEYKESKKAEVKSYFDQKIAEETQKSEERAVKVATKAKEKYLKDGKKGQEKSGMSDEQIERNAGFQYDNIYKQEKDKLNDVVKVLKAKAEMFERVFDTFNTDDAYVLPVDMNNPKELSGFGNSYGRLVDVKITDNFSPNASSVSFATLDGRRKITFPITGKVGAGEHKADVISAIAQMTRQASAIGDKHLHVLSMDVNNWDRLTSNESRKDGYIITGNLMQALIDAKNQGVGGQLVKYTTDAGEVKTGILMPDRFKPTDVSNEYPISSVAEKFGIPSWKGGVDEVVSSDGSIKINHIDNWRGEVYEIRVPKSKAKGGKYFLDEDLMGMMNGKNFESRGNSMLGVFEPEQLRPILARLSNLGVKVKEERKATEDGTHFRTNDGAQGNDGQSIVVNHIAKVSEKLGTKVNMVNSPEEITNKRAKEEIEAGKNVQGWYDEKTGEVHLYMPNIHDRYTAEKTIWHETVGHKGMRELIGDERFDAFLDDIYRNLDSPEYADLKKLVDDERKYNPFNYRDNIEEGIARLAEEGHGDVGFWRNLKNKVSDFLHEIGYRFSPNTKDVKYLLWLSKNMQKHPNDPYFKMRAEAVRYRLDHESMPEVKTEGGMFRDNDGKTRDLGDLPKAEYQEATDGKVHFRTTPSAATAIDRYHRALNAHSYMATESFMDNMLSLQALMKAVDPSIKKIEDVKSSENPYMLQNTMQGAMSNAAQMFERNVMQPLDKAMGQLLGAFEGKKDEDKIRNFNLYMITKHGLERNRVLFVRDNVRKLQRDEATKQDAKILQQQWDAEKKDLGDKLRDGSLNLEDYYKEMDEWIRNNVDKDFDASEHDYSGMHGVQGIDDNTAPYNDAEAIKSVMDSEAAMEGVKAGSVKDFWSKVHAATSYSLYCDYANGFQSRETYTKTSQMFDWYVPLRKFDEKTAEDVYGYVTEKGDPSGYIGSVVMGAKGRKSLSEVNVLAQIGAMGNMAISNGGKNAIKQAFMRFARSHDSQGLITEGEVWLKKDGTNADGSDRWVEVYPQIPDGADPNTVSNIISKFEADMKAKQATGDAKVMRNAADIGYKFERAKDKSQHVVDVKVNGKTHRFYINGNPRAAQALNGMLENKGIAAFKFLQPITRTMAQLCTSFSPEFVVRNVVRDMQFAASNITAKEGLKYAGRWGLYYAEMLPIGTGNVSIKDLKGSTGLGLYAKYRNGTLDTNNKIHKYFKEFMENGGETGWVQVLSMKDWEKRYKRDIKTERSKLDKGGKAIKDFVFGNLENLNEVAENMARFATFCTSRDYGRSAVRSAYDAKEVSTNFNRHGSGDAIKSFKNGEMGAFKTARRNTYGFISSYLRQTSMFFNAGIQSTNLLAKNVKNAPKGTAVAMMGVPFAMGMLIPLLNKWLISEEDEKDRNGTKDPYAELPDYIRRNNLCIYKGGGEFVTVPLAIELRAFYGLGDLASGYTLSPNIKSQRNAAMDAVGCVSQLVPVMDYTNSHAVDKDPVNETIKALSPSALSPFVEWNLNSDWKGAPIRREKSSYNENQPAWMRAYKNTPKMFMNLNKMVNASTNDVAPGNEEMLGNGFLDAVTDPAALNHYLGGFGGGAATFATRLTKLYKADNPETNDIPFLRSFLYEPNEQSSMQRTKSKWYNYVDDMEKTMSNVQRLKAKNVPIDKRLENIGAYYNFKDSKEAQKAEIIEQTQKMMKRWKTMRDKSSDATAIDNANKNIDLIMQESVEKLDKLN